MPLILSLIVTIVGEYITLTFPSAHWNFAVKVLMDRTILGWLRTLQVDQMFPKLSVAAFGGFQHFL